MSRSSATRPARAVALLLVLVPSAWAQEATFSRPSTDEGLEAQFPDPSAEAVARIGYRLATT